MPHFYGDTLRSKLIPYHQRIATANILSKCSAINPRKAILAFLHSIETILKLEKGGVHVGK